MKTINFLSGISAAGLSVFLIFGCSRVSPADAVKAAMEKEIVKERAMEYLEEHDVPAVVVEEFIGNHSDTLARKWLAYKKSPEEAIKVELPEVYIVQYSTDDQGYAEKYSSEGKIIETNRSINFSVLPDKASDQFQKGGYKDWEVTGDVLELLDNLTNDPIGYVVTAEKEDNRERIFFNREGDIVKVQKLT